MDIANLCYELYKIDWKQRISVDRQMSAMRIYYDRLFEDALDESQYAFDEFINDYGYNGESYVCFEEFLCNEFEDAEYIKTLLTDTLYEEYLDYISEGRN